MTGVYDLAKAATYAEGQEAHEFNGAYVTSVNVDGTVSLNYLGEEHPRVEALASYMNRQIGDLVLVRSMGDHWTVIGKVGDAFAVQFPPPVEIPDPLTVAPGVTWGTTDPSPITGWNSVVATWVHNDGRIYFKTGTGGGGNVPPPVEPPPIPPGTVTLMATTSKAYTGANINSINQPNSTTKRPQGINANWECPGCPGGPWGNVSGLAQGPWCSAWYYGVDLENFVIENYSRITKMELRIVRSAETHGWPDSAGVSAKMYLHDHQVPPSVMTLQEGPFNGPPLARGAEGWFQVPKLAIDLIRNSGAKGFAMWSDTTGYFFIAASGTGQVKIHLS